MLYFSYTTFAKLNMIFAACLLYTSDAADDSLRVDLGGRRIIKKFFFKQKTAYEIMPSLVCSEMCIRDRTCRALDEGFDLPDIEVGIFAAMTKSPRQRIQRLGRVLRPADGKVADIRTLFTLHEENFLIKESDSLGEICQITWMGSE